MVAASSNHSHRKSGGGDSSASVNKAGSAWAQVVRGADSESNASPPSSAAAVPEAPSTPLALAASQGQISNYSSDCSSPSKAAPPSSATATVDTPSSPPPSTASPDYSAVETQAESSDNANRSSNAAKKPAWNKPSNGGVEVGPVMGGEVWPALSASARAAPKSTSSDSLKALSDGSTSATQGTEGTGVQSSQSQTQSITNNNTNHSFTPHSGTYTRQKSMKGSGGSSSGAVTANGSFISSPSQSSGVVGQMPNSSARPVLESPSPRDHHVHRETGPRGLGTQSHTRNDHSQQRNTFRRGNNSPRPRGDGSFHHNYRARSEQDRGNGDWNSHRSFSSRDAHMQPQRGVARGVIRPMPHGLSPYMPHPMSIQPPLGNHLVYPEVPPPMMYAPAIPEGFRGVPILSPRVMFLPLQLHANIMSQIHYYFSDSNLCKDIYLRKNMDEEGWVPIELIAGFQRVRELTDNVQIILDTMSSSTEVEVQGDKIRKRNDWKKWIMPPSVQFPTVSSPRSLANSIQDPPVPNIQGLSLEQRTEKAGTTETSLDRSSSGDLGSSSQRLTGEGTNQDNAKISS